MRSSGDGKARSLRQIYGLGNRINDLRQRSSRHRISSGASNRVNTLAVSPQLRTQGLGTALQSDPEPDRTGKGLPVRSGPTRVGRLAP